MVREGLTEEATLEQGSEAGAGHEATQQKVLRTKEYQVEKPLQQERSLRCAGTVERPPQLG